MNFCHTGLSELYKKIEALGDPLSGIGESIDFERIRPILFDLYENVTGIRVTSGPLQRHKWIAL